MTLTITNVLQICAVLSAYYDIPPEILPAMVRVESDYRQHVVSHKGAVGIIQITEGAWECYQRANPTGVVKSWDCVKTNWVDNLRVGAWYLKRRCYAGDWKDAISSYFWGPNSTRATDTYYNKVKDAKDVK
jgi:soluble lytic murein transglycosylase